MKGIYAIAIVAMLLLMVGCSKPAAPEAAPVQQPAAEPAAPAEEPAAEPAATPTGKKPVLNEDQAVIDRLTKACQAGNAGVCATLKNKYGLDVKPGSQEETVPAETTE